MPGKILSKSRYLSGLQCQRLLWFYFHDPEKIAEPDTATQRVFDQGHLVGELAKKLYPGGIDVPHEDFKANLEHTRRLRGERKPLFEADFLAGNLFSRLDILKPFGRSAWDIIEVKSTTSIKETNLMMSLFRSFVPKNRA
jgi:hypothetical protein